LFERANRITDTLHQVTHYFNLYFLKHSLYRKLSRTKDVNLKRGLCFTSCTNSVLWDIWKIKFLFHFHAKQGLHSKDTHEN